MIFIDIGNTFIKVKGHGAFSHNCIDDTNGEFYGIVKKAEKVIVSSVVPVLQKKLIKLFAENFAGGTEKLFIIKRDAPFSFNCNLTGVGIDRMLAVQGALTITKPPFVTVDIGTAVTVNICAIDDKDKKPEFVSGLIMPGLKLMLKSMNDHTAQLPLLTLASPLQPFGKSTEAAMIAGVNHLLVGGIERSLAVAKDFYKVKESNIYITGGGAEYFKQFSKINVNYCEDLIFKGMEYIFKNMQGGNK